jgi:hypothetical protein
MVLLGLVEAFNSPGKASIFFTLFKQVLDRTVYICAFKGLGLNAPYVYTGQFFAKDCL